MTVHIFYPDNVPRADRLQALIDHVAIIQTDVAREKRRMEELDKEAREALNALLKQGQIKSLEELNEEAMTRLTPVQKKEYQALIDATKQVGQVTNTMLWAGLVFGGDQILRSGAPFLMSLVRGLAALQGVQGIVSAVVGATEGIAAGAAAAGEGIAQAAQRATQTVAESGAAGAAAVSETGAAAGAVTENAVAETKKVTNALGFMGKYGKWLSRFGVVLLLAVPLVEVIYGHTQKEQLLEAIHNTQVARLVIAALREEARQITNNMSSIKSYLKLFKDAQVTAAQFQEAGEEIIEVIRSKNAETDLTMIERSLRAEIDQPTSYTRDDMSVADVVLLALDEQAGKKQLL